ncbi:MAG: esterase-like activity of phytase family protein, partial [Asticcacaulis sp.]
MRQKDIGRIAILSVSVLALMGFGLGVVTGRQLRPPLPDAFAEGEAPVLRVTVPLTPFPLRSDARPREPASDRVGALIYRGGLSFSMAQSARLGGVSALHVRVRPNGQLQVVGLSDTGDWLAMALPQPEQWAVPDQETVLHLGFLQDADGRPYLDKRAGDAESLAVDPATGTVFVGFEQSHRIQRYPVPSGLSGRAETQVLTNLPSMPRNRGFEALTVGRAPSGASVLLAGTEDGDLYDCPVVGGACR